MAQLESAADTKYMLQLPTVSFRVVNDDKSLLVPAGVHSEQLKHYGYNDFSDFERPDFYIRYIEPIESELAVQVEYDMDEQDQEWLDVINAERKKDQSGPISYEVFEIIMDKLEKEWFNLIKRIPQPVTHMPVEDSKCAICDDGEGENSNAIVFCDGCNLAVHQDCYGVPYIPEGQWLCRKCTVSPENPVSCLMCPNEGGAFKQTSSGHWAHLLCAIWIPELQVGNAIYMEPVEGVELVPKSRWKLHCSLCRERHGACIQCDNRNCFTAFHVTCARQMGLLMSMKTLGSEGHLRAFCEKHLPDEMRDSRDPNSLSPMPSASRKRRSSQAPAVTTKSARAHAKSYRPGPPIVPQMIVQKLLDYVSKISIRKRQPFVERLCRYWSLKREARRGAPLLKRLHLEPWTASNADKQQTDAEKAKNLEFLTMLRNDLEKVRMLAELARKREKEKLKQVQLIKDIVDGFIFPHYGKLRVTLEKISAMDRQELFLNPVNKADAPDYFDIVKEPMCWLQIDEKIDKNTYRNISEFKHDVNLVLDNAMLYNAGETLYHKVAKRVKSNAQPLLDELEVISAQSTQLHPDHSDLPPPPEDVVGDLEPSLLLLQTLLDTDAEHESDTPRDLLASIFAFQLEKPRPLTPPPPSPKAPPRRKTEAERKKAWQDREAAAATRVPQRSTRGTQNAEQSFKRESGIPSSGEPKAAALKSSRMRSQVGVTGTEQIEVLTDRQRRERERQLDLVTDEIGSSDLFTRFNVGWVLPDGAKRRRTGPGAGTSTSAEPTSRKSKAKASSSSMEPLTSSPAKARHVKASSPMSPIPSEDGSDLSPLSSSDAEEQQQQNEEPTQSRGGKRKARESLPRSRKKGKAAKSEPLDEEEESEEEQEEIEVDEDDEGDVDGDVEMKDLQPKGRSKYRASVAAKAEPREDEGEDIYPPGTLVWAKLPSFPFFPAEVIDPASDPDLAPDVLAGREKAPKGQRVWLVKFFDSTESYGWIAASSLDSLGIDDNADQRYLAGKQKNKSGSFKSTNMKKAVAKAYRDALGAAAGGDDDGE